jgi:dolichol-phosphate mannosyltransferase
MTAYCANDRYVSMIFIILPVYNEEKNIAAVIANLRKTLSGHKYRIVAVNDGSRDKSLSILQKLSSPDLVIISSIINMNVGAVFSTGLTYVADVGKADDIVVIMESDGTSSVEILNTMISQTVGNHDIVIASRYANGGAYKNFPFSRLLFSRCANYLLTKFFPIPNAKDYTIFYRGYRVGIIQKAITYFGEFGLIQSIGFVANAELLIKLSLFTKRICEVPFIYDYGKKIGKSKIGVIRTINEYISVVTYLNRIKKIKVE